MVQPAEFLKNQAEGSTLDRLIIPFRFLRFRDPYFNRVSTCVKTILNFVYR